jgi:tetratricopeptide (TPR) repeat protein
VRPVRLFLVAALSLWATRTVEAQISPPELEEASEVARRAASATLRGQNRALFDVLDTDGILERRLGEEVWKKLTPRQRELLRAAVRQTFTAALSPPHTATGEITWSSVRDEGNGASVFLGIQMGERWLKMRWSLRRSPSGDWRVIDVTLSDPGLSLASAAGSSLGPNPVEPRDRRHQARQEALPRLAILGAIAAIVLLAYRRLTPPHRVILLLTASAPAILFLVNGVLAVRRALAEPYTVAQNLPRMPWQRWQSLAREAEQEGRLEEADRMWQRALGTGAAPGAVAYDRGMAARDRGDLAAAGLQLEAALDSPEPAPGAARELALIALSEGKNARARDLIGRYLQATGPDPDALSIEAVTESNLGQSRKAVDAIQEARELIGGGARGSELEARIRARAADAAGAVAALRELAPAGRLDREALRADPAYLPIATDPVWVAFVNENAEAPPVPSVTPTR